MPVPYIPKEKSAEAIIAFFRQTRGMYNQQWQLRSRFETIDRQYQREVDQTEEQWKAKQANRRGDPTKFQNITMPVVLPQVENAVTYQQSVFLTGYPIFGVVSTPEHADSALQMDSIIGEHQRRGNWVAEFLRCLRSGFKYNLGAVEVSWEQEVTFALEEGGATGSEKSRIQKQRQVVWEGNKIKALDMYNTFWDTRVPPHEVCRRGEFAGYTEIHSRISFKQFLSSLPASINTKEALESGETGNVPLSGSSGSEQYFVPIINPDTVFEKATASSTNWMAWAHLAANEDPRIKYRNSYEVVTLYARILPEDFKFQGVPAPNTPQVWKFIIVNNQVVVYAERLTNMHGLIPIFFAQPHFDELSYQTKSLAENVMPFQEITTALANSMIHARRRAVSDRMLFDPSRVAASQIRSDSPVAKIPIRPSAFGTNPGEAVHQLPFRDDQYQFTMDGISQFNSIANQVSGLNPARQGQFVRGNKTRFEFQETMGYANGRDQTIALTLEGNFFAPIKQVIKSNILQYQGGVSLFNPAQGVEVRVDPVTLRKAALEFKIADGLNPADKLIDGESFAMFLQTVGTSPELAAGYNIAPMISYLMKSRGANLQPFEKSPEQIAYEQALGQWQQAVAMLAEQISKVAELPSPEDMQQMLPPQPMPEQFGYDPGKPNVSLQNDGKSVYQRYAETVQAQQQAMGQQGGEGDATY